MPVHHRAFAAEWQRAADACDAEAIHLSRQAKGRHDASARLLPVLRIGPYMDVQDHVTRRWDLLGVIVGVGTRRDYLVKMGSGRTLWRNRKFLRRHRPIMPVGAGIQHLIKASFGGRGATPEPVTIELSPHARPKALLPSVLRREALAKVAARTTPASHYFTDGSVGEGGTAAAAFVCGPTTSGHRLPTYTTAFQAELVGQGRPHLYGLLGRTSLSPPHCPFIRQLLSAIRHYLHTLHENSG